MEELGSHLSIAGGFHKAAEKAAVLRPSTSQIFTTTWQSLFALALAACLPGCGGHTSTTTDAVTQVESRQPEPVTVTAAPVVLRPVQRAVQVVGTLHGWEELSIAPKVEARVRRIYHDVGDRIRPGEPLLELDATDFQLAVDEAQRALLQELAKLGLAKLPPEGFDVTTVPSVAKEKFLLENTARKLARTESLFGKRANSQEEFDQAKTDHNVAEAAWQQAAMDAQATLAAARHKQAMLATAVQRLADTRLAAPALPRTSLPEATLPTSASDSAAERLGFVVAARRVSEGEMVRDGDESAFRLVVDHPLKLVAPLPEQYSAEVKLGQEVEIRVEAYPGKVFAGKISRLDPTIDSTNRTLKIEAIVPNEAHELKPGGFAKVSVLTRVDEHAKTVPTESIVQFAGVTKVFQVRDGAASSVEVKPGVRGRGWIEVNGPLEAESLVITSGQSQLAEGTPVQVRREPAVKTVARPQ